MLSILHINNSIKMCIQLYRQRLAHESMHFAFNRIICIEYIMLKSPNDPLAVLNKWQLYQFHKVKDVKNYFKSRNFSIEHTKTKKQKLTTKITTKVIKR